MKHGNFYFAFIIAVFFIISGCATVPKTPLIEASTKGDAVAVQKLINEGANINEPDSNGATPLMNAITEGKTKVAKYLIESGANIKVKDKSQCDALCYAVQQGNIEIVKSLISKNVNLDSKDGYGITPLAYAASTLSFSTNAPDIMKLLIKSGANINEKTFSGETVLDLSLSYTIGGILDDLTIAGVNPFVPESGKARLLFFGSEQLWDYCTITVGKQSKRLNGDKHWNAGIAFIDVESGKQDISLSYSVSNKPILSIDAKEGQTYYFKVTQNTKQRIWALALTTAADKVTGRDPFMIMTLKESEAKQEIKEILKPKELKNEIVVDKKPNLPTQTNSETKAKISNSSEYAEKLRELKKLKDEGLLTDKEYEQKRKSIVDAM
jgi:hypothetical protein